MHPMSTITTLSLAIAPLMFTQACGNRKLSGVPRLKEVENQHKDHENWNPNQC